MWSVSLITKEIDSKSLLGLGRDSKPRSLIPEADTVAIFNIQVPFICKGIGPKYHDNGNKTAHPILHGFWPYITIWACREMEYGKAIWVDVIVEAINTALHVLCTLYYYILLQQIATDSPLTGYQ